MPRRSTCRRLSDEVRRVAAVEEDEAILGIEDRQAVRDALGGGEEARLGLAPVGDVGGQQHAPAIGHPRLADSHPAAVDMLVLALGEGLVARRQSPLRIVRPHVRMVDRATRQTFADPVLEADSERQTLAQGRRQELGMPVVVEGDPVIGIEDDQAVGNAAGCGQETRLARLQRGLGADSVAHVALGGDEVGQLAVFAENRRDRCFLVDQAARLVPADDAALPHPTRTGLAVDLSVEFRIVRVAAQDLAWGSTRALLPPCSR